MVIAIMTAFLAVVDDCCYLLPLSMLFNPKARFVLERMCARAQIGNVRTCAVSTNLEKFAQTKRSFFFSISGIIFGWCLSLGGGLPYSVERGRDSFSLIDSHTP